MKIQIELRSIYGVNKAYPVDRNAECLAAIAGTKTMTINTLVNALRMGFDIEVVGSFGAHTIRAEIGPDQHLRIVPLHLAA
jgi:hypothetical protein